MSVSQILVILLRRAWIVMLALLTTVIVAGGVLLFVPGRYDAVATASIDPGNLVLSATTAKRAIRARSAWPGRSFSMRTAPHRRRDAGPPAPAWPRCSMPGGNRSVW